MEIGPLKVAARRVTFKSSFQFVAAAARRGRPLMGPHPVGRGTKD